MWYDFFVSFLCLNKFRPSELFTIIVILQRYTLSISTVLCQVISETAGTFCRYRHKIFQIKCVGIHLTWKLPFFYFSLRRNHFLSLHILNMIIGFTWTYSFLYLNWLEINPKNLLILSSTYLRNSLPSRNMIFHGWIMFIPYLYSSTTCSHINWKWNKIYGYRNLCMPMFSGYLISMESTVITRLFHKVIVNPV